MIDMDTKFDIWKNRLLDMRKRNKMLNYRDTKCVESGAKPELKIDAKQKFDAPLVLVLVTLSWESITSSFILSYLC